MRRAAVLTTCAIATVVTFGRTVEAQVTETYVFRDSMLPTEGAGRPLEPVHNGTGAILTEGPGFVGGTYVTHSISASACASSPTVRAWAFPESGGLRHPNSVPAIITGSYSISMLLRFHPMDGGYARLIDFSDSTADSGIYKLGDGVSFYPVGTFAAGSFVDDQDVFVTVTRDATSGLVSLYINGIASGTYTDTGGLYAPAASAMYFMMDNTSGSAAITETDPGVISYLQLRDTPMTPAEVMASLAAICDTVACGDGMVGAGEACDDGGVAEGDGCSPSCAIEAGWVCSGAPSACAPVCGDGAILGGEACDDGGVAEGDGCSVICEIETGYFCAGEPSACALLTMCTSTEYESTPPTPTSDRVCTALTTCTGVQYESSPPTATSDRACTACTVCAAGTVEVTACSATADTVCTASTDGGARDAGVDGGASRDASTAADASAPLRTDGGSCGCVVAAPAPASAGAALASAILIGVVLVRRARRRCVPGR